MSSNNSLVGSTAGDMVGSGVLTELLTSGNYLVSSPNWSNVANEASSAGAVTWVDGTNGNIAGSTSPGGMVSATNSLVGSTTNDAVGSGGIRELFTNKNYLVLSPGWDNLAATNAGAVTFGNGGTGVFGVVSNENSLVGSKANDLVGTGGTIELVPSGNYLVLSGSWNGDAGAVTFGSGTDGVSGAVSSDNSLVGSTAGDRIGSGGITQLFASGNYVVSSPNWSGDIGAVTWGSGIDGVKGTVSLDNSLVGSTVGDQVGLGGITELFVTRNYLVNSFNWNGGAGAVTLVNGTNGNIAGSTSPGGAVSIANSLVGSSEGDFVGSGGIFELFPSGNYLVFSPNWNNFEAPGAGAVTFGSGAIGVFGEVSAANSLVGTHADDQIGSGGVFQLSNGDLLVRSLIADRGAFEDAGLLHVVTFGSGDGAPASGQTFASDPDQDVTIAPSAITAITNTGTAVVLQANNDITLATTSDIVTSNPDGAGGDITLEAGRSILLNASITTDNGNLVITANHLGADSENRDEGAGGITMASATTLNAGSGNATLMVGSGVAGAESGNLVVDKIIAANVQLRQNGHSDGSSILQVDSSSLIRATNLFMEVNGGSPTSGSIGTVENPILTMGVTRLNTAVVGTGGTLVANSNGSSGSALFAELMTSQGGNISLVNDTDIAVSPVNCDCSPGIFSGGGNIYLQSTQGSITGSSSSQITASASSAGEAFPDGGRIDIIAAGDVGLPGPISSDGYSQQSFDDTSDAGSGGKITLLAGGTVILGLVSSIGGSAEQTSEANVVGGRGGNISVSGADSIDIGFVDATGGSGANGDGEGIDAGAGGRGGHVEVIGSESSGASISVGTVNVSAGQGGNRGFLGGAAGGDGGEIVLTTNGTGRTIEWTDDVQANAGDGGNGLSNTVGGAGGIGGTITLTATGGITSSAFMSAFGGAGGTSNNSDGGAGGLGGEIKIIAGGPIDLSDSVIADGGESGSGSANGGSGGNGGDITISGTASVFAGSLSASGGNGADGNGDNLAPGSGGAGGTVAISTSSSDTTVVIGILLATGGKGGDSGNTEFGTAGGEGGEIEIFATTADANLAVTVTDEINASGGDGGSFDSNTGGDGGEGGSIAIYMQNGGTLAVDAEPDLTARGGSGGTEGVETAGAGGAGGSVFISSVSDEIEQQINSDTAGELILNGVAIDVAGGQGSIEGAQGVVDFQSGDGGITQTTPLTMNTTDFRIVSSGSVTLNNQTNVIPGVWGDVSNGDLWVTSRSPIQLGLTSPRDFDGIGLLSANGNIRVESIPSESSAPVASCDGDSCIYFFNGVTAGGNIEFYSNEIDDHGAITSGQADLNFVRFAPWTEGTPIALSELDVSDYVTPHVQLGNPLGVSSGATWGQVTVNTDTTFFNEANKSFEIYAGSIDINGNLGTLGVEGTPLPVSFIANAAGAINVGTHPESASYTTIYVGNGNNLTLKAGQGTFGGDLTIGGNSGTGLVVGVPGENATIPDSMELSGTNVIFRSSGVPNDFVNGTFVAVNGTGNQTITASDTVQLVQTSGPGIWVQVTDGLQTVTTTNTAPGASESNPTGAGLLVSSAGAPFGQASLNATGGSDGQQVINIAGDILVENGPGNVETGDNLATINAANGQSITAHSIRIVGAGGGLVAGIDNDQGLQEIETIGSGVNGWGIELANHGSSDEFGTGVFIHGRSDQSITVSDSDGILLDAQIGQASIRGGMFFNGSAWEENGSQRILIHGIESANELLVLGGQGNAAVIEGSNQWITAGTGTQAGAITIQGGTGNFGNAWIFGQAGTQKIETTGLLSITAGSAQDLEQAMFQCGLGGACALIGAFPEGTDSATVLQSITADSILVKGGDGGAYNEAALFSRGNQEVTATGTGGIRIEGGDGTGNYATIAMDRAADQSDPPQTYSQTIDFGDGNLEVIGGASGGRSYGEIFSSGDQTITGAGNLVISGGVLPTDGNPAKFFDPENPNADEGGFVFDAEVYSFGIVLGNMGSNPDGFQNITTNSISITANPSQSSTGIFAPVGTQHIHTAGEADNDYGITIENQGANGPDQSGFGAAAFLTTRSGTQIIDVDSGGILIKGTDGLAVIDAEGPSQTINIASGSLDLEAGDGSAIISFAFGDSQKISANSISLQGGNQDGAIAVIEAFNGTQEISATGTLSLTAGQASGPAEPDPDTPPALFGAISGSATIISRNGLQTIDAFGITLAGGGGNVEGDASENFANIRSDAGQHIIVGGGGLTLQGGPGSGLHNFAMIENYEGEQKIEFADGAALEITGGDNGVRNFAGIFGGGIISYQYTVLANTPLETDPITRTTDGTSSQQILGNPEIILNGGASGGGGDGTEDPNFWRGNTAFIIAATGDQTINAQSIDLAGGSGSENSATISAWSQGVNQSVTALGSITLNGGIGQFTMAEITSYGNQSVVAQSGDISLAQTGLGEARVGNGFTYETFLLPDPTPNSFVLSAGASGSGSLLLNGGSIWADDELELQAGSAGRLTSGSIKVGQESGAAEAATIVVDLGTALDLSGSLSGGAMTNDGAVTLAGGSYQAEGDILNSGVLELRSTTPAPSSVGTSEGTLANSAGATLRSISTGGTGVNTVNGNVGNSGLIVAAHDLTISGALTIPSTATGLAVTGDGMLTLNGLTVNATDALNQPVIGGTGLLVTNGTSTINGGQLHIDTRDWTNLGTTTIGGRVTLDNGVTLTNASGAILTLTGTNGTPILQGIGSPATVTNSGTVTKAGTATQTVDLLFDNGGTVNINGGVLQLGGNGVHTGSFVTGSGAELVLTGGTHVLNAGAGLSGTGTVRVNGATLNANTSLTTATSFVMQGGLMTGTGNLIFGGPFTFSGGTIGGTGVLTTNGTTTINNGTGHLDGRNWNNFGGMTINGRVTLDNGAVFTNGIGGTLTLSGANATPIAGGVGLPSTFNNAGTMTFASSTPQTISLAAFNNSGALSVNTGSALSVAGPFNISGGSLSGAGSVTASELNLSGGSLNGTGNLTVNSNFTQSGGNVGGNYQQLLLALQGDALVQQQSYSAQDTLALAAGGLITIDGQSLSAPNLILFAGEGLKLRSSGTAPSLANATISLNVNAPSLVLDGTNGQAKLDSVGTMTLAVGSVNVTAGAFGASIDPTDLTVNATGDIVLTGGSGNNASATISGNNVTVNGANIILNGGSGANSFAVIEATPGNATVTASNLIIMNPGTGSNADASMVAPPGLLTVTARDCSGCVVLESDPRSDPGRNQGLFGSKVVLGGGIAEPGVPLFEVDNSIIYAASLADSGGDANMEYTEEDGEGQNDSVSNESVPECAL